MFRLELKQKYLSLVQHEKIDIPGAVKDLNKERLFTISVSFLDEIRSDFADLVEKTERRLSSFANEDSLSIKKESAAEKKDEPECPAVYEQRIKFSSHIMRRIDDNYYLLLPFNKEGKVGFEAVHNYCYINPEDARKFNNILEKPRFNDQAGIKFLPGLSANYKVRIHFENETKEVSRPLVAEMKIQKSVARIGLFALEKSGRGPTVLACGSYLKHGLHAAADKRNEYWAGELTIRTWP